MASRNPALPLDSHVQSDAEVLKNKLFEFLHSPRSESDRRWLDLTLKRLSRAAGFRHLNQVRGTPTGYCFRSFHHERMINAMATAPKHHGAPSRNTSRDDSNLP
jgi:hypothetical protein